MAENNFNPEDYDPYDDTSEGMLNLIVDQVFKGDPDLATEQKREKFKENFYNYAYETTGVESTHGKYNKNKLTTAKGSFQFVDEAFVDAKDRVKNLYAMWIPRQEGETKEQYAKKMEEYYPSWLNKQDPTKLSPDEQYALFYANTAMQSYRTYDDSTYEHDGKYKDEKGKTVSFKKGDLIYKGKQGEYQKGLVNNVLKQLGDDSPLSLDGRHTVSTEAKKWLFWNTHYRPSRFEYLPIENSQGTIRSFKDTVHTPIERHQQTLDRMEEYYVPQSIG